MEKIHLDPSCDFVSVKSAESDGIQFDVALQHYQECARCRDFHALVLQDSRLLQESIERAERALVREEEIKLRREQDGKHKNEARLNLILAHLEGCHGLVIGHPIVKHWPSCPSGVSSGVEVETKYGSISVEVRSESPGYALRMPGWSCTKSITKTEDVVVEIGGEIARIKFQHKKAPASARGHADET